MLAARSSSSKHLHTCSCFGTQQQQRLSVDVLIIDAHGCDNVMSSIVMTYIAGLYQCQCTKGCSLQS